MYFCILQEANNIFDLFVYILENLPPWNPYFEVYELANKICNRCKMDLEYPVKRSYGMIITADSLRETKASHFFLSLNLLSEQVFHESETRNVFGYRRDYSRILHSRSSFKSSG